MKEMEIKTILLIGRSGRGKSTLANVLSGTNNFKESSGSASETKKIQFEEFDDPEKEKLNNLLSKLSKEEKVASEQDNLSKEDLQDLQKILQRIQRKEEIKYRIIDTPGIGDTKMSDNEVLDIIAEAVYLVRDGVSQVFFVINSRFDQSEMATYNLLRTIIFDEEITKHTTIVRTRFEDFKSEKKCETDINLMVTEAIKRKIELKSSITTKEEEMKNLSPDNVQYQKILAEIEKLKKDLTVTNLAEIIESCQRKVVHVDNPPIIIDSADDEDDEEKKEREEEIISRGKTRRNSRKKILEHSQNSCLKIYNPPKLQELSKEIAEDYFNYMEKKRELEEELEEIEISENKTEKEEQITEEGNIEEELEEIEPINVSKTSIGIGERITQLESKKSKLKKEITEKEQNIRKKVLKHVFNNYDAVSNEIGGGIFLDSITEDNNNWKDISQTFADKKLILEWRSNGFDYHQVQKWAAALGNSFDPKNDAGFCAWLRDVKKLFAERIKELSHTFNVEQLRKEYAQHLEKEVNILGKHNQQLSSEEEKNLAQKWLDENYPKENRAIFDKLDINDKKLTGLLNLTDFVKLEHLDFSDNNITNLTIQNCPRLREIYCSTNNLTTLAIDNQPVLTYLNCSLNDQLTSLVVTNNLRLTRLYCSNCNLTTLTLSDNPLLAELYCLNNQLTSISFLTNCNTGSLTVLAVRNNRIRNDLSLLRRFTKIEKLYLSNNFWTGGLESLSGLSKLKVLEIKNLLLTTGLEYLPANVEKIYCTGSLAQELKNYERKDDWNKAYYSYQDWRKNHQSEINSVLAQVQIPPKTGSNLVN